MASVAVVVVERAVPALETRQLQREEVEEQEETLTDAGSIEIGGRNRHTPCGGSSCLRLRIVVDGGASMEREKCHRKGEAAR